MTANAADIKQLS